MSFFPRIGIISVSEHRIRTATRFTMARSITRAVWLRSSKLPGTLEFAGGRKAATLDLVSDSYSRRAGPVRFGMVLKTSAGTDCEDGRERESRFNEYPR